MTVTVIASPWSGLGAGDKAKAYLRACIRDSLARDEIPWASHAMLAWTRALYEEDEEQRAEGILVSKKMIVKCELVAVYVDHGISAGMKEEEIYAKMHGKRVERRSLYIAKGAVIK
ncbi:MAG TPA: hypothetical protein VMT20_15180 [Terriglobia bacterium]|nr:hypothetical protein [Terriglobia bacterium]